MTRRLLPLAGALLALAITSSPAAAQEPCAGADSVPTASSIEVAHDATLCLINRQRTSRGLKALKSNGRLRAAAEGYSRHMVRHTFFAHDSAVDGSSMSSRIRRADYLRGAKGWRIGENLAWGSRDRATPRNIVQAWMKSPPHRANILSHGFREIGIGIAAGAPVKVDGRAATYTTDFGARS